MIYHIISFAAGFVLDFFLGDPHWLWHPVCLIGKLVSAFETWNKTELSDCKKLWRGAAMVFFVLVLTCGAALGLLVSAYRIHPWAGCALESVMMYQLLAARCLETESMKVCRCLEEDNLAAARTAVSMIVGRDTDALDETGVAKAAVETVAENTSDGVIAPMLYLAIGGPAAGFLYKAVNTMDSMVGYKNEKYLYFGRCAAGLDDILNFIPARISALLMIAASFLSGKDYNGKNAWRVWKRDRRNHASPNSAQTESVCAGSLGICLAGNASYFGKTVEKPTIGDTERAVEYEDIKRANMLMYRASFLCYVLCLLVMVLSYWQ